MTVVRWLAQALGASALAAAVGAALGLASPRLYVLGLTPLLLGVAAGAAAGFVALRVRGAPSRGSLAAAALAVLVGWTVAQAAEDAAFRRAWIDDWAAASAVANGLPAESVADPDERAFFEEGGAEALDRETRRQVGASGAAARWWLRASAGVRLFGPWEGGRGLPVGRAGAVAWAALEVLLALLVARAVLRRLAAARAPEP